MGPAIEQLLHHIHESGELQKALRERTSAEQHETRKSVRPEAKQRGYSEQSTGAGGHGEAPTMTRRPSLSQKEHRQAASHDESPALASPTAGGAEADNGQEAAEEPLGFDPLIWLSECLARSATGPTEQYRDHIEERVLAHIHALEALEERQGEEEEAAAAAAAAAEAAAAEGKEAPRKTSKLVE